MKWRYDRHRCRLNVMNPQLDFAGLRSVIDCGLIPRNLDAIVYTMPGVTLILRGHHLRQLMAELRG